MKDRKSKKNVLQRALLAGTLALGMVGNVRAEDPKINWGYNALETGVSSVENAEGRNPIRNRLYTNFTLDLGEIELSHHGLNEINDLDLDTYFGRNRAMIGLEDVPVRFLVDTKATRKGVFDTKFGIRNTSLIQRLGGYGQIDLSANHNAVNLNVFYGRPLGNGFSAELSQDIEFPYGEEARFYTELQLNKRINDKISLFGRAEIPSFTLDKTNYLVGLTFNFGGN